MFKLNITPRSSDDTVTVRLPWRSAAWIGAVATLIATLGSCLLQILAAMSGLWCRQS